MPQRPKLNNIEIEQYRKMGVGLSCAGVFWAILSFLSLGAACVGFYLPYWLEGEIHLNGESIPTFIGVFRRCHYLRLSAHGDIEVVRECGRYETFFDIPSQWWQISTVTISAGCILLLFVSVAGIFSCCVQGVLSHTSAKVAGVLQFIAGELQFAVFANVARRLFRPCLVRIYLGSSRVSTNGTQ